MKKLIPLLLCAVFLLSGCQTIPQVDSAEDQAKGVATGSWINIAAGDRGMPVKFLRSPKEGKSPTVFLMHGTNGPDARTEHWAKFFNQRGYNALIVDYKTGRFTGPEDRKNLVAYPLIQHARNWLLQQPTVDSERIVWMGLSLGAGLGLTQSQNEWSAFILMYPGCWNFTKTQSPKPIVYWAYHAEVPRSKPTLLVYGKDDEYEEGKYCPEMLKLMSGSVDVLAIDGAHHAFDGNVTASFRDPASPSGFSSLRPNQKARAAAEQKIIEFLNLPKWRR
jgi:dienelactone hydrolase